VHCLAMTETVVTAGHEIGDAAGPGAHGTRSMNR